MMARPLVTVTEPRILQKERRKSHNIKVSAWDGQSGVDRKTRKYQRQNEYVIPTHVRHTQRVSRNGRSLDRRGSLKLFHYVQSQTNFYFYYELVRIAYVEARVKQFVRFAHFQ
jgi:hypothetical protein